MSHYITAVLSVIAIVSAIVVNVTQYPVVWQMMEGKMPQPRPTVPISESPESAPPLPDTFPTPVVPEDAPPADTSPSPTQANSTPVSAVETEPSVKTSHATAPIPFEFFRE